jgi:hypothetical protein
MLNQRFWKARTASALPCENPQQIIFVEAAFPGFPIWEVWLMRGTPPPWSIGITDLGKILDLIYGLQSLSGKILSRKGLAAGIGFSKSSAVSGRTGDDLPFGVWKARSDVT